MTAAPPDGEAERPLPAVGGQFLAIGAGEAVGRVLSFLAAVYVTRIVGPDVWGTVAFSAAVTLYLAKLCDLGIETVGTAEVSEHPARVVRLVPSVLMARLAVAGALSVGAAVTASFWLRDLDLRIFLVSLLALGPIAASSRWVHLGLMSARPVGLARGVVETLVLVTVLLAVRSGADAWILPLAIAWWDAAGAGVLLWLLRRAGHALPLRWEPEVVRPVLARAWPVMVQTLLGLAIYNSDMVILRLLRSAEAVGYYAAAYALISFAANVSVSYSLSILPALSRVRRGSADEQALHRVALMQALTVTMPVAVGGAFVAGPMMVAIYGATYERSGALLTVLLVSVPLAAVRMVSFSALVATHRQHLLMYATAAAAVLNLGLNVLLIGRYDALGAAWSTVLTELTLCTGLLWFGVRQQLPLPFVGQMLRPTLACVAMAVVLWRLPDAWFPLRVLLGAAVYAAGLVATGMVRHRDGRITVSW